MASLADWGLSQGGTPLGLTVGNLTPQFRLNETYPALQEDASIATTRSLQDYAQRSLPDQINQGAAMGQTGSSGLQDRIDRTAQDTGRNIVDIQRMLGRNVANLAQRRILSSIGSFSGGSLAGF